MLRYSGGKADWLAHGLPREGGPARRLIGDVMRRDVPTCRLGERVGAIRRAARAAGADVAVVTTDEGVVLGMLDSSALEGNDDRVVDEVMDPAPVTIRPSHAVGEHLSSHV